MTYCWAAFLASARFWASSTSAWALAIFCSKRTWDRTGKKWNGGTVGKVDTKTKLRTLEKKLLGRIKINEKEKNVNQMEG